MAPFAGRGDNMVKLRGVNVWPEAVGDDRGSRSTGAVPDYFVRAVRDGNRDELVVSVVERARPGSRLEHRPARSSSGSRTASA